MLLIDIPARAVAYRRQGEVQAPFLICLLQRTYYHGYPVIRRSVSPWKLPQLEKYGQTLVEMALAARWSYGYLLPEHQSKLEELENETSTSLPNY
jgi:hypothetical protein